MAAPLTRTFHETATPYSLPNDASEHERLDLQGEAIRQMLHGRTCLAPLSNPRRLLDVGSGTGAVVKHLATQYPQAEAVIGIDLSPAPQQGLPANVSFVQGDFRAVAASPNHPEISGGCLDYIFSRMLVFGMTDWPAYIAQAKDLLAPGGWIEIQEIELELRNRDDQVISGSWKWLQEQHQAFSARGLDLLCGRKMEQYLRDAGFVDVTAKRFRWMSASTWEGHPETDMIAAFSQKYNVDANIAALNKTFASTKSQQELASLAEEVRNSLGPWTNDGKHKPYWVVYGRKPGRYQGTSLYHMYRLADGYRSCA